MKCVAFATLATVALGKMHHEPPRIISGVTAPNMTEYLAYKAKVLAMDEVQKALLDKGGIIGMPGPVLMDKMHDAPKDLLPGAVAPDLLPGAEAPPQQQWLGGATHGVQQASMMDLHPQFRKKILSMRQEEYAAPELPPYMATGVRVTDYDYENPQDSTGLKCNSDEAVIQIQGLAGVICVPECTQGLFCNAPTPPSMNNETVSAQCALESPTGASYCALVCSPYDANGCPKDASCKSILTSGLCTYDV